MKKKHATITGYLPVWSLPLLSGSLAMAVHMVWGMVPLNLPDAIPVTSAPSITAVTSTEVKDWTPVLFSLPSREGFSSLVKGVNANVLPPVTSPLTLTQLHDLQLEPFAASGGLPPLTDESVYSPITTVEPVASAVFSADRTGWQLILQGDPTFPVRFYRDSRIGNPASFFSVTGEVTFDAIGQVSGLVIEPSPADKRVISSVLPDLRRLQISEKTAPARFRFSLTYIPPGKTE